MHGLLDTVGRVGANVLKFAVGIALFVGPAWVGYWVKKRTAKSWAAWTVGLLTWALLVMLFGSAMDALDNASCRGVANYLECIRGD